MVSPFLENERGSGISQLHFLPYSPYSDEAHFIFEGEIDSFREGPRGDRARRGDGEMGDLGSFMRGSYTNDRRIYLTYTVV